MITPVHHVASVPSLTDTAVTPVMAGVFTASKAIRSTRADHDRRKPHTVTGTQSPVLALLSRLSLQISEP